MQEGGLLLTTPSNASYRRRIKALKGKAPDDEGYHFRFWVKEQRQERIESAGLRVEWTNSYEDIPFVDTLTLYKSRTGNRRNFRIGRNFESIFAGRFVWFLRKS